MFRKLSYIGALIILLFLAGFSLWQKQVRKNLTHTGQTAEVIIRSVLCTTGTGQSSLYFLSKENQLKKLTIDNQDCNKYNEGDTLTLLYNEKGDFYLPGGKQN